MSSSTRRLCGKAVVLVLLLPSPAPGEALSRVEISKLGKAATILVEMQPKAVYGSAFCVHPSGLFLTNQHVTRHAGAGGVIDLVLDPGLKSQRLLKAKVVRADKDSDLALLRVEGEAKLPALVLGSADDLTELMEVIAFGFPFGLALALDRTAYPAISVKVGSVTSLHHKEGELHRVQLDSVLDPGNSGGPVLDRNGKVVGVVAGVPGAGVTFATPVNYVTRLLAKPDIQFTPPVLTRASLHKPVQFQARAVSLLPSAAPLALELVLQTEGGKERRYPMQLLDGAYRATAEAVPAPAGPSTLRIAVRYDDASVTGSVADQTFTVGGREVQLSAVRHLRLRPKTQIVLQDGRTVEGALAGLNAADVRIGEERLHLDLSRAVEARIEAPAAVDGVACTIVVSREGQELGRVTETIAVQDGPETETGTPAQPLIRAPSLGADRVVRQLPGAFENVAVGGGGRYLVLHLPRLRTLAVFDAAEARVVRYLSLPEDNIKFAAGADKLIVVLPGSRIIQRWSLATLEREAVAPLPVRGTIKSVCMGSASNGPLLVHSADGPGELDRAPYSFLSIHTLKPLPIKGMADQASANRDVMMLRVSAEGQVFGRWCLSHGPSGLGILILSGNEVKTYYVHDTVGHIIPSADGQVLYTGRGLYTNQGKPLSMNRADGYYLPAQHGPYYLSLARNGQRVMASLYLIGDGRPLITLAHLDELSALDPGGWGGLGDVEKRIHLLPDAKLLLTLPPTNDRVVLHRFDVEEALERSGVDYLLVTSQPSPVARKGRTYTYQLAVKSKKGGLQYKLESGPKGMAVSETGQVSWPVPADFAEAESAGVITVRDTTGQECFHSFNLRVRE